MVQDREPTPAEAVLVFVAAWGLPGATEPMGAIPGDLADAVVARAKAQGLLGPLLDCMENGALTMPASAILVFIAALISGCKVKVVIFERSAGSRLPFLSSLAASRWMSSAT